MDQPDGLSAARFRPARTLLSIRVAFWIGVALTLLWAPLVGKQIPPFRAYDARSDLLFDTFAHWDAQWFLSIAKHGYDSRQSTSFFPLYPLFVHAVAWVTRSTVVAGVLISLVAAGFAAVGLARIARPLVGRAGASDFVLLVALYPLAFVFTAPQSDALFLALVAWSFAYAMRGNGWAAGVLGGLAVATRLIGLALAPALLVLLWPRRRTVVDVLRPAPILLLPAALGAYMLYLDRHIGDSLAFQHAQQVFWHRETPATGPLGGLWESILRGYQGVAEILRHLPRGGGGTHGYPWRDHIATWNAIHLALLLAAIALTWVAWKRLGPAFGLYSVATLALVLLSPPKYFPLASFPRYLLGDFPVFLALAALVQGRPRLREVVLCAFAAVGAVAAVAYSRGVWVG
ncbi:MAG TPA: mannosyltransferase family protein [Gaiellaceae bacterium]